jgi:hypothetical protein
LVHESPVFTTTTTINQPGTIRREESRKRRERERVRKIQKEADKPIHGGERAFETDSDGIWGYVSHYAASANVTFPYGIYRNILKSVTSWSESSKEEDLNVDKLDNVGHFGVIDD